MEVATSSHGGRAERKPKSEEVTISRYRQPAGMADEDHAHVVYDAPVVTMTAQDGNGKTCRHDMFRKLAKLV